MIATGQIPDAVSPLSSDDVDCLCRCAAIVADCDRCGERTVDGCHMGIAFYGWYCPACCYTCTGELTLTPEEFDQMERNREEEKRLGEAERVAERIARVQAAACRRLLTRRAMRG